MPVLAWYSGFLLVVRYVVFGVAVIAALVAVVDWAVRTRRLNAFGVIARFMRRAVDPAMRPIERRVVRAGGQPSSAPWWMLVTVVVGGLLLIAALQFLAGLIGQAMLGMRSGAGAVLVLLSWTFGLLKLALIVRVASSWFGLSPFSRWIRWSYALTEWILAPLRRVIPLLGPVDITPLVAWFLIAIVQSVLVGAL